MSLAALAGVAPVAGTLAVLALAVLFTRSWVNDTAAQATRRLRILGIRPGRNYELGSAWTQFAARDRRNILWAGLAVAAWIVLVVSLDGVRR